MAVEDLSRALCSPANNKREEQRCERRHERWHFSALSILSALSGAPKHRLLRTPRPRELLRSPRLPSTVVIPRCW